MARTGDGVTLTWRYTYVSLWLYVFFGYAGLVANLLIVGEPDLRTAVLLLCVVGCVAACWRSLRHLRHGYARDLQPWRERVLLVGLAMVPVVIGSWDPPYGVGVCLLPWVIASVHAADLPGRARTWWLLVVAAASLGLRFAVGGLTGADPEGVFPFRDPASLGGATLFTLFVPVMMTFQTWLWDLVLRVRDTGETEAELARVRERLRFAADLHDVQGHHLQVIALKTELADRLIDAHPDQAHEHVREAQAIARQAISETRDLVRGYRAVSLRDEAANAASVLEASGARCAIDVDDRGLDLPLLASLLREATTNILRHSDATTVQIDLRHGDPTVLTVRNDGAAPRTGGDGTGLTSLAERFVRAGGDLTTEHADGRFVVVGSVPREDTAR